VGTYADTARDSPLRQVLRDRHGASGEKLYPVPDSANAHDRRNGVPGVQ